MTTQQTLPALGVDQSGVAAASVLVGRDRELAALERAVARTPGLVLVQGEAGIGKTRLMRELAARSGVAGRRFVVGCCRRIREPFPLGPVLDVVRGLGDALAEADLSPVVGALRPLLPEVADLLPARPEPLDDRLAERYRVFRGLVEVLGSLGPAVLVLEDLHWADEQTIDFVSYLLSDPPPQLSVVVTYRQEDVDPAVRASMAKLPASVSRTHLALAPLDVVQTGELATAVLGVDRVSTEFADYLCVRASGLPFAIEELLALLRARGTLVRSGGSWVRRTLDELDVPSGIRDPVLERVSRLSDDERAVVEAAAVLQVPVPASVLLATARVGGQRASRGLELALEARLLSEQDDTVGFRHVLAAQAVYDAIPGPRRRDLHARAAAVLGALDRPPLGQLAHHLRHAGRLAEWVDAAERAADRAVELGHDTEAARLLEDLLRNAPLVTERRGRVAVKLAEVALEVGAAVAPFDLLSEALRQLRGAVRGELGFRLAVLLHQAGRDAVRQFRLFADAVEELDHRPDLKAWAMMFLGLPMGSGVPLAEHLGWLRRCVEALSKVDNPSFEVFLLGKVAAVRVMVGDPDWRRLTKIIETKAERTSRRRHEVIAYYSVGSNACLAGHHDKADQLLAVALAGVVACESRRLDLTLQADLALLNYCRGAWDGLPARVDVLLDELADHPIARVDVEVVAACLMLAHGDLADARGRFADVAHKVETTGNMVELLPLATAGLARLAVARGEVADASADVARFLAAVESKGTWPSAVRALPALTQALTTANRLPDADALVDRFAGELRDLDAPLAAPALRHARGFLEAAAGRSHAAAKQLLAAAELYEPLLCPYEAAQANEQAALALFTAGDSGGEQPLRAALATYERLGATWDLSRAASIARQHGVSLPTRHRGGHRGYGPDLSPREQRVAELAAAGLTNKEIAQELFVSPNTVDKHLRAGLRKLGLHSRTALARHVSKAAPGADSKNGGFAP